MRGERQGERKTKMRMRDREMKNMNEREIGGREIKERENERESRRETVQKS